MTRPESNQFSIKFTKMQALGIKRLADANEETFAGFVRNIVMSHVREELAGLGLKLTKEGPVEITPAPSRFDHLSDKPEPGNRYSPRDRAIMQAGKW